MSTTRGFSLVEALLGVAVFGVVATAFVSAMIYGPQATANAGERARATLIAQEGIEAVRAVRDGAWNEMTLSLAGVDGSATAWEFDGEGTDDTIGDFTRQLEFSDICRDGSGDIAACPADETDPDLKQVKSTVTWSGQFGIPRTVEATTLLSNWQADIWDQTDWVGGDGQAIWSDETRYDTDDGQVDVSTVGQVEIGSQANQNCGVFDWEFDSSGAYTFNSSELAVGGGVAELAEIPVDLLFEVGETTADGTYSTVTLQQTYVSPVVVAFHEQANTITTPVSVRVDNVTTTSFDVRLQHAATGSPTVNAETVYYIVVEEGTGTIGGMDVEAHRVTTATTGSRNGGWAGDTQTYSNVYTVPPVVLHQVQTENDSAWTSTFVSSIPAISSPPTVAGFRLGLNTAETATSHSAETIGWIAFENGGTGVTEGVGFETQITTDTITGFATFEIFGYLNTYASAPLVVGSQQEMDGNNGGWLVANVVSPPSVDLFIDEDIVGDTERNHTTETGAFVAFAQSVRGGFGYPTTSPTVVPTSSYAPATVDRWVGFAETATKEGSAEIFYQLSDDDGATWQYWDGAAWATAVGATDYNTATDIHTNISAFSASANQLMFRAFFVSNGSEQATLDTLSLTCERTQQWPFDTPGNYTYNGTEIEVTGSNAQLVSSAGSITGIADPVVQSFEFDVVNGEYTDMIQVGTDTYAVVSQDSGNDGIVETFTIDTDGTITTTAIDSLVFHNNADFFGITHVQGDIYAIAYSDTGANDGWVSTVTIDNVGQISNAVVDQLEFNTSSGQWPAITTVNTGRVAVAYRGPGNDGFIDTIDIDGSGNIAAASTDSLEFDTANATHLDLEMRDSDTAIVVYRGPGGDGFVRTIPIDGAGLLGPVTDTLEFDTGNAVTPTIDQIDGSIYGIAYGGTGNDGFLSTLSIDASGAIGGAVIDSYEFDTSSGIYPELAGIGNDLFVIAYRGPAGDGFLSLLEVSTAGAITTPQLDSFEFNTQNLFFPAIAQLDTDTIAVAYESTNNDGFITTIDLETGSAYPTTEPTIQPTTSLAVDIDTLSSFTETATAGGAGASVAYQLSDDDGVTWQYWDGAAWATAVGATDYNTATDLNANVATFDTTANQVLFRAFLISDGVDQMQLDTVEVGYTESTSNQLFADGQLTSSALDMTEDRNLGTIEWDEDIPGTCGTCTVELELRTAPDGGGSPGTWTDWYGTGGSGTTFTDGTGEMIPTDLNGNQWIQYRATLTGDGVETPLLEEVRIRYGQ